MLHTRVASAALIALASLPLLILVDFENPVSAQPQFNLVGPSSSPQPTRFATGDFDEDGFDDLAVVNNPSQALSILFGDATGSYGPGSFLFLGDVTDLLVAHVDGDDHADIVFFDNTDGIGVLLGNGDGSFGSAMPPLFSTFANSMAVGDFDEDGILDLVTENSLEFSFYQGLGDGELAPPLVYAGSVVDVMVADIDEDGHLDVVGRSQGTQSAIRIVFGDGNGGFPSQVMEAFSSNALLGFDLGDVNGDMHLDLVVAESAGGGTNHPLRVALGDGSGDFGIPSTTSFLNPIPRAPRLGDLDGDSVLDLLVPFSVGTSLSFQKGLGDGGFESPAMIVAGFAPEQFRLVDVTTDGVLDVVLTDQQTNAIFSLVNETVLDQDAFLRGDFDTTGSIELLDGLALLGFLFLPPSPAPSCPDAADFNDDGALALADGVGILNFLFIPGSPPSPPPGPFACGPDPTADELPVCEYDPGVCP